jgi:hypothetical protein
MKGANEERNDDGALSNGNEMKQWEAGRNKSQRKEGS